MCDLRQAIQREGDVASFAPFVWLFLAQVLGGKSRQGPRHAAGIAVFAIMADVVEVKTGSWSTAHWRIHSIRPNGWLRHSAAQLITLLDIDCIGQNWEGSNILAAGWVPR